MTPAVTPAQGAQPTPKPKATTPKPKATTPRVPIVATAPAKTPVVTVPVVSVPVVKLPAIKVPVVTTPTVTTPVVTIPSVTTPSVPTTPVIPPVQVPAGAGGRERELCRARRRRRDEHGPERAHRRSRFVPERLSITGLASLTLGGVNQGGGATAQQAKADRATAYDAAAAKTPRRDDRCGPRRPDARYRGCTPVGLVDRHHGRVDARRAGRSERVFVFQVGSTLKIASASQACSLTARGRATSSGRSEARQRSAPAIFGGNILAPPASR